MHTSLLPVQFASIFGFEPWTIAIFVPIAGMTFGGIMAFMAMYFNHQRRKLWHETTRIALEKGQPIPPYASEKKWDRSHHRETNDFRGGLVLIAIGAGIYLFFVTVGAAEARFIGAIPGFIGVALLLHGLLTALLPAKNIPPDDRPPHS